MIKREPAIFLVTLLPMLGLDDMAHLYMVNARANKLLTPQEYSEIDFAELFSLMLGDSVGPNKLIVLTRLRE